jgi:hypothetical protein
MDPLSVSLDHGGKTEYWYRCNAPQMPLRSNSVDLVHGLLLYGDIWSMYLLSQAFLGSTHAIEGRFVLEMNASMIYNE